MLLQSAKLSSVGLRCKFEVIVAVHTLLYLQEAPLAHQNLKTAAPEESVGGCECEFVEPPTIAFQMDV